MASTDLRTAAQQALEALKMMRDEYEEYACPACDHADAAIYALKEALVEDAMQRFTDVNQEIEAALAEDVVTHGSAWSKDGKRIDPTSVYAEPVQEPDSPERRCGGPGCDMTCCQPVAQRGAMFHTHPAVERQRSVEAAVRPACGVDPAAKAEPVQEPVAIVGTQEDTWKGYGGQWAPPGPPIKTVHMLRELPEGTLLYAAPPQRPAEPVQERDLAHEADMRRHARQQLRLDCMDEEESEHYCDTHCTWADHAPGCVMEERNFCPRCGKRTNGIHTCTPPAPLTDEVIADLWHQNGGFHHHFARAIERWLRGHA